MQKVIFDLIIIVAVCTFAQSLQDKAVLVQMNHHTQLEVSLEVIVGESLVRAETFPGLEVTETKEGPGHWNDGELFACRVNQVLDAHHNNKQDGEQRVNLSVMGSKGLI